MSTKEKTTFNNRIGEIIKNFTKLDIYFTYLNNISELFLEEKKLGDFQIHINIIKDFLEKIKYVNMKEFYTDFVKFVNYFITISDKNYYKELIEFILKLFKYIKKQKNTNLFFINVAHCELNIKKSRKRSTFCNFRKQSKYSDKLKEISNNNKQLLQNLRDNIPENEILLEQLLDSSYKSPEKDNSFFNIFFNILIIRVTKIITYMPLLLKDLLNKNIKKINDNELKTNYEELIGVFSLVTIEYNQYLDSKQKELCKIVKSIKKKSHCKSKNKIQCTNFMKFINSSFCKLSSRNDIKKSINIDEEINNIKSLVNKNILPNRRASYLEALRSSSSRSSSSRSSSGKSSSSRLSSESQNSVTPSLQRPSSKRASSKRTSSSRSSSNRPRSSRPRSRKLSSSKLSFRPSSNRPSSSKLSFRPSSNRASSINQFIQTTHV